MQDFLKKYDAFFKGKKTYTLIAVFLAVAIYGHAHDLGEVNSTIDNLSVMLTDRFNQLVLLLGAWKAFNRASQDA